MTDRGVTPSPLFTSTVINVTILDFNDNAPRLVGSADFSIEENEESSWLVGQLKATDDDIGVNAHVMFSLDNGEYFIILYYVKLCEMFCIIFVNCMYVCNWNRPLKL